MFLANRLHALILAASLVSATFAVARDDSSPATMPAVEPATAPAAEGMKVETGTLELAAEATGYYAPIDALEVTPKLKAFAGELKIKAIAGQGAAVKKGDTLLEIDRTDYDLAVAAAGRELALAKALAEKTAIAHAVGTRADALTTSMQQRGVDEALAAVDWWDKYDGPQMLQGYELQVKNVQDAVDDASDELDQLKKMYKSEELTNATSDIVVKRAVRGLEEYKVRLEMTKATVEKAKQTEYAPARQRVVDAAEQQKQAFEVFKADQATHELQRAVEKAAADEALRAAEKKSTELAADAPAFKVVAPADGMIYLGQLEQGAWTRADAKALAVGENVVANQVILTFFDPAKLRLNVTLSEEQAVRVIANLPAWVTPVALPELACAGKTTAPAIVAGTDGAAGGHALVIDLDRKPDRLRPGMKAAVSIDLPDAEKVLLVPASVVHNGRVIVKRPDGKTETRDVILGRTDGKKYEVVSGLSEGETVVEPTAE